MQRIPGKSPQVLLGRLTVRGVFHGGDQASGLKLTKDVILANMDTIYEVHLKAAEIELELAYRAEDLHHIRNRSQDIMKWLEDPLLPTPLKETCEKLYKNVNKYLRKAGGI